jgi:histidine triad (HIT) family protein
MMEEFSMAEKNIFQKIIDKEIPADIVYEDEACMVFRDVSPQAPVHVLVIPKQDLVRIDSMSDAELPILQHLWKVIRDLAPKLGLTEGYRVVLNNGPQAGQEVEHIHFHVLGGRSMGWPPG